VLSYEDVARRSAGPATNVVIHEFAHKLDMRSGEANGSPPLHKGMNREQWKRAFMEAYLRHCKPVDHARSRAPYDGGQAQRALLIDPYGAETPAEFFAVISEAFFESPETVIEFAPSVYTQLKSFYRQDPLERLIAAGVIERVQDRE
jgi:MtfA peptidase